MAVIATFVSETLQRIWDSRDTRSDDWHLVNSLLPTLAISLVYIYLVRVVGPRFMADRSPFELRWVLVAYNLFQILFKSWMFYEFGMSGWFTGQYNFFCHPVDYSETVSVSRPLRIGYWYFISKFIDFFDTFFFVLRKKEDQISGLHLWHHFSMPFMSWLALRFVCGGHITFIPLLNTLEHVVMYLYYLMTALGPEFSRFIWWKKHLTTFQMTIFILTCFQCFQIIFQDDCPVHKGLPILFGCHSLGIFFLYLLFFKESLQTNSKSTISDPSTIGRIKKQS